MITFWCQVRTIRWTHHADEPLVSWWNKIRLLLTKGGGFWAVASFRSSNCWQLRRRSAGHSKWFPVNPTKYTAKSPRLITVYAGSSLFDQAWHYAKLSSVNHQSTSVSERVALLSFDSHSHLEIWSLRFLALTHATSIVRVSSCGRTWQFWQLAFQRLTSKLLDQSQWNKNST